MYGKLVINVCENFAENKKDTEELKCIFGKLLYIIVLYETKAFSIQNV